jgi:hypothetical protein
MRRTETRIHRKKKKEYYEEQMKQVEKLHGQKESRRMYRFVDDIRKEFKPYTSVCIDSTGMILREPSEIKEQWRQYFQNLLKNPDTKSTEISQELGEGLDNEREEIGEQWNENEAPKIDEVTKAKERLKSNRSPRPDNIIAELLKTKQEIMAVTLQRRVCQIWKEEIIPEQWEDGLIWPIRKKDQLELNSYRGIALLNTGYKIFSKILYECLQPYLESIVGKYQCGFRKRKSTIDQIQSMRDSGEDLGVWNQHVSLGVWNEHVSLVHRLQGGLLYHKKG